MLLVLHCLGIVRAEGSGLTGTCSKVAAHFCPYILLASCLRVAQNTVLFSAMVGHMQLQQWQDIGVSRDVAPIKVTLAGDDLKDSDLQLRDTKVLYKAVKDSINNFNAQLKTAKAAAAKATAAAGAGEGDAAAAAGAGGGEAAAAAGAGRGQAARGARGGQAAAAAGAGRYAERDRAAMFRAEAGSPADRYDGFKTTAWHPADEEDQTSHACWVRGGLLGVANRRSGRLV